MGRAIDPKTRKTIEIVLQRYPERKKKLEELIEDIVLTNGTGSGKTNFDTEYSKPQSVTESKALKLNSPYYTKIKEQINAIESVYEGLSPEEKKVIRLRYWTKPDKKIPYSRIDVNYSEVQMKRIVAKTIYKIGLIIGEIER